MEKLRKFDIARDIKTTEDGGFFCQACHRFYQEAPSATT